MTRISHFQIGLLFLASVAIIAAGLFWLGTTGYIRKARTCVTYFDSSVQGLSTSSQVKYLGLNVGRIASLELARGGELVRVVMKLDPEFRVKENMAVHRAIKGITGQSYLVIARAPENVDELTPEIGFPVQHPLIPSVPGRMERLETALGNLYTKVESLDLAGLIREWKKVASSASGALDREAVDQTLHSVRKAAQDIRSVSKRLKRVTAPLEDAGAGGEVNATLKDLAAASRSVRNISGTLEKQMDRLEPGSVARIAQGLNRTLESVEHSAQDTNSRVSESLLRFRESLVRLNQVLAEIRALARSLRTEPGRILNRTREKEPFAE
jgi:phospholipid/cholesterol/gamma-HCH transport system substrate-binding protein